MDICELIQIQIETMTELNELLDYEKEVLIYDRASELPGIVEKKNKLAQAIFNLERERLTNYKDAKASQLVEDGILEFDDVKKLKELSLNAKEKGETNMILTRQSLNYIRVITNALNPVPPVVTYGNNGQIGGKSYLNTFNTRV